MKQATGGVVDQGCTVPHSSLISWSSPHSLHMAQFHEPTMYEAIRGEFIFEEGADIGNIQLLEHDQYE